MERFVITFLGAILLLLKAICAELNEANALMAFKDTITSDPKGVTDDWIRNLIDPCPWGVILCDGDDRVSHINLPSAGLSARLVADLGNLSHLQYMTMQGNKITGQIPSELRKLANLRSMDLYKNKLDGPIPKNVFHKKLKKLLFVRLQQNNLTGSIPTTLAKVPFLQVLDLSNNLLTGEIPEGLVNLTDLRSVDFSNNQLTGRIPAGLANLTDLRYVNLSNNQLSGPVPEFKKTELLIVDVGNNPRLCGPFTHKKCSCS